MHPIRKPFLVMGTLATKQREIDYLCDCLKRMGHEIRVRDVSLARYAGCLDGREESKIRAMELTARAVMSEVAPLISQQIYAGVIAMGGGVGTWLAGRIMQHLPDDLPKIILSTLPYDPREVIGSSTTVVVPSIVDILGLNPILKAQIERAAALLTGWAGRPASPQRSAGHVVGITALGITTSAVNSARAFLEARGYEVAAFHANGVGDDAFERFTAKGMFCAVLDLTPSALTSQLFGGVARHTASRLEAAGRAGIPRVIVPGGLSLVSRGPLEGLGPDDLARPHYRQNLMFTHVRLDQAQMRQVAEVVAARLNPSAGPVAVVIPLHGFSSEDRPGGAIHDPEANQAFVETLAANLRAHIRVHLIDAHINTDHFAEAACKILLDLSGAGDNTFPGESDHE